jgi:hypothetical protein
MIDGEDPGRRAYLRCVAATALLVVALRLLVPSAICDDAYITMKMGQSLALGHGLAFNPGERLHVSTAPLWSLLIALARWSGIDTVLATRLLGGLAEVALAVGMVRLGRVAAGSSLIGLVGAVLLMTNPALLLTSFSGMELPFYLAAIAWSLGFAIERRFSPALAIAALAVWIRFDGVLLYLLVTAVHLHVRREELGVALLRQVPSVAIVAGYACFGSLYFGDLVPITVQRKLGQVAPFSHDWAVGAGLLATNFALAFIGCNLYWYRQLSPLVLAPLLLIAGVMAIAREWRSAMLAPLAFALWYAAVFIGSGRQYAGYFPWYFMPPLVTLTLLAALGASRIASRIAPAREQRLLAGFASIWAVAMAASCFTAAHKLEVRVVRERERVYAAATVWLSRHLPQQGRIAANEIGTAGFFKRDDLEVLDLFGLLRTREDRDRSATELVAKYRPEAVITREIFDYRDSIEAAQPNAYVWLPLRSLHIGLRADLAPRFLTFRGELDSTYAAVDLDHEIAY